MIWRRRGDNFTLLLTLIFLFRSFLHVHGQSSLEATLCVNLCMCVRQEKTIDCNTGDHLLDIPTLVPTTYNKLLIQHGMFESTVLIDRNMTGLTHLVLLKIIYSGITTIQSYTFRRMELLEVLDLSANQLQSLENFAFAGLRLKTLNLQDNIGLRLNPGTFWQLQVKEINLRNNGMRYLQYESFLSLGLERLFLFNNHIKQLDPRFRDIFDTPTKTLDLTKNPLHCSCDLKWYLNFLNETIKQQEKGDIHVVCETPEKLRGKSIGEIVESELLCPRVIIRELQIDLNPSQTSMRCSAEGNPPPGLAWSYLEEEQVKVHRREPPLWTMYQEQQINGEPSSSELASIDLNVSLSHKEEAQVYTCSAWNKDRENEKAELLLRIKVPPSSPSPPSSSLSNQRNVYSATHSPHSSSKDVQKTSDADEPSSRDSLSPPYFYFSFSDKHFLFKKQFSLLELVLSIVGTFVITVIVLILIFRFIHWYRHRQQLKKANRNVFWSTPATPYSGKSSHEYDVPIMGTPYHPIRHDQMEFLDFKTHQKLPVTSVA
jgi:hypothetical protein